MVITSQSCRFCAAGDPGDGNSAGGVRALGAAVARGAQDTLADATSYASDCFGAIRTVQAFNQRATGQCAPSAAGSNRPIRPPAAPPGPGGIDFVIIFIVFSSVVAILWVGSHDVLIGSISRDARPVCALPAFAATGLGQLSEVWAKFRRPQVRRAAVRDFGASNRRSRRRCGRSRWPAPHAGKGLHGPNPRRAVRRHRTSRPPAYPGRRATTGRTQRPNATSGITITGIASSTKPDSFGLVITIMVVAPMNSIRLRSGDRHPMRPTADLIWVVSAVSRDTSSPLRAESKNAATAQSDARTRRA